MLLLLLKSELLEEVEVRIDLELMLLWVLLIRGTIGGWRDVEVRLGSVRSGSVSTSVSR